MMVTSSAEGKSASIFVLNAAASNEDTSPVAVNVTLTMDLN